MCHGWLWFCRGAELVVRSHEVKEEGYQMEHDGKLVTVFSAPNYCDRSVLSASVSFFRSPCPGLPAAIS